MTDSIGTSRSGWPALLWVPTLVALAAIVLSPGTGAGAWVAFGVATAATGVLLASADKGPILGAYLLLASIALKDGILVVIPASVGVFQVALGGCVLAAIWSMLRGHRRPMLAFTPLELALATPALAGLWSLPTSLDLSATALYSLRFVMLWVVAVIVSRSLRNPTSRRRGLEVFAIGATVLALVAAIQWIAPSVQLAGLRLSGVADGLSYRPSAFYMDPNFMAAHLVIGGLVALALSAGGSRRRRWWIAAAALMFGVVALAYSRSAWLALAAGMVVLGVLSGRRQRIAIAGVLATAALAGVVLLGPSAMLSRLVSVVDVGPTSPNAQRLLMLQSSGAMIADRPIFGTGLEGFDDAYAAYVLPGGDLGISHPHQVPVAMIVETGLGGAAALVALVVAAAVAARSVVKRAHRGPDIAIVASLVAVGVGSLFQYFAYFEPAWLVAGLLAAAAGGEAAPNRPARAPGPS
jgi:O-antigen ligase